MLIIRIPVNDEWQYISPGGQQCIQRGPTQLFNPDAIPRQHYSPPGGVVKSLSNGYGRHVSIIYFLLLTLLSVPYIIKIE